MTETPRSLTPTQLDAYLAFTEVGSLLRPAVEAQLATRAASATCSSSSWRGSATPRTATCA
jgi:hypothetical protein